MFKVLATVAVKKDSICSISLKVSDGCFANKLVDSVLCLLKFRATIRLLFNQYIELAEISIYLLHICELPSHRSTTRKKSYDRLANNIVAVIKIIVPPFTNLLFILR